MLNTVVRPIKTEESTKATKFNKFTFEVNPVSTKHQIKKSIEDMFDVKVLEVRTIRKKGKSKRRGRLIQTARDTKKAIVKIKEGQTIPLFESEKKTRKTKPPLKARLAKGGKK